MGTSAARSVPNPGWPALELKIALPADQAASLKSMCRQKDTGLDASRTDQVVITVRDHGPGVPPADLGKIFDPFFTTKDRGRGTGLGLATVYGIVQQHDGWIELKTALEQGTTFQVFLPCCPEPGSHHQTTSADPVSEQKRPQKEGVSCQVHVPGRFRAGLIVLRRKRPARAALRQGS